jgi:TANFOR domain-containing protein
MRKLTILFTFLLTTVISLQAQPPVQVTPQLLAPYTTQVSEYYSAVGNPKLSLLLLNRDFNRPTLSVRLRMSIEGQGISIKTREDVNFTPVTLLAGQPYFVTPTELTQYFNVNNIILSGITQQEYIQTGKLPEGFYTYCFETVETTTGQTVSNKGCTFAWINLNEPPLLNIPAKGESVIPKT